MKKILMMLVAMVGLMSLNSCSKDENGVKDPTYNEDAAMYVITDNNSPYSSIEFTEGGQYIIIPANQSYKVPVRKFIGAKGTDSRANYDGYLYGDYTKTGENEYYLEGFGTIVVKSVGGTNYDLVITTDNGSELTLGARRESINDSSEMTDKLCRTWKFVTVGEVVYLDGKKIFDQTINVEDLMADEDFDEIPSKIIFTRAGTYMVVWDDQLDIAYWKWENEKKGILRYSWNYDYVEDPEMSGTINVSFDGSDLIIFEEHEESEDGQIVKMSITYRMKEVR